MRLAADYDGFYDPEVGPGSEVSVRLRRASGSGPEEWFLDRRIAYRDRFHSEPIVVPRDGDTFRTDLTSVPRLFTWLVGRTGTHLPAALIHDALTPPFSGAPLPDWSGPPAGDIDQLEADRIFRDAMNDLGTPLIRRWLVWSAVSLPTVRAVHRIWGLVAYLLLLAIAILGWFATLDLFDQGSWLFWMGNRSWNRELILGVAFAVLVPLILAMLWPPRLRTAGAVSGVALAALLHVTVAILGVTAVYQVAEFRLGVLTSGNWRLRTAGVLVAIGVTALTIWMCQRY
jgi:hypothetical protein